MSTITEPSADSLKQLEASAAQTVDSLKTMLEQGRTTAEAKIRENPLGAVAGAAAIGFVFRFGLVRGLLGFGTRLALFSVKPLLIVAALMKVVDLMKDVSPPAPETPKTPRLKTVKTGSGKHLVDAPEEVSVTL